MKQPKREHPYPNNVRLLRWERGWTLKELSRYTGISATLLDRIEKWDKETSLEELLALEKAFNAPPWMVLGDARYF